MDFLPLGSVLLPAPLFHYIDGGADDEWTLGNNTRAFDRYELLPGQLRDVSRINLATRLLGTEMSMPFVLAPTGMKRLFHRERELAVARAAGEAGVGDGGGDDVVAVAAVGRPRAADRVVPLAAAGDAGAFVDLEPVGWLAGLEQLRQFGVLLGQYGGARAHVVGQQQLTARRGPQAPLRSGGSLAPLARGIIWP